MSAHMPSPFQPHDPELDRALALARTPQVPEDLAARILHDVTRLPQEPTPLRPAAPVAEPARRPARPWLRAAGFAALTLLTGAAAATLLLQNGSDGDQPVRQIAAVEQPTHTDGPLAPVDSGKTAAPATGGLAAPRDRTDTTELAVKPTVQEATPATVPAAPTELANEVVTPPPVANKPSAMAQNGPIDTPPTSGPLAPTSSTYGPPAGLGISNGGMGGGVPMPEGSGQSTMPRSGPSGMPGGMPGGGMPGGGPRPRH